MQQILPYRFKGASHFSRCLVRATPNHGWAYSIVINGITNTINGGTPWEVFLRVKETLEANGIEHEEKDIWASLNLSWLLDIGKEHRSVSIEDFLGYVEPADELEMTDKTQAVWSMLEVYLAKTNYSWDDMQQVIRLTLDAFSSDETPSLGDPGRCIKLIKEVSDLYKSPIYSRQKARDWYLSMRVNVDNAPHTPTLW